MRTHLGCDLCRAVGAMLVVVFCVIGVSHAMAGSVLLGDPNGTAQLFTGSYQYKQPLPQSATLTAPSSGKLQNNTAEAGYDTLEWNFTNGDNAADLIVDAHATIQRYVPERGWLGVAGGELALDFVTDQPLSYHLFVQNDQLGNAHLLGAIDDKWVATQHGHDVDPVDFMETSGILQPGAHTFSVHGNSDILWIGWQANLGGQVGLELRSRATAVPLPAAVWPGMMLLGAAGYAINRRVVN